MTSVRHERRPPQRVWTEVRQQTPRLKIKNPENFPLIYGSEGDFH